MRGLTTVAHSYLAPSEPEYREVESQIVKYEYDPRRAVSMIEGLGYRRGADGVLVDSANRPLAVQVRGNAGDELRRKVVFAMTDEMAKIGIASEPSLTPTQRTRDVEYVTNYPAFQITQRPNQLRALSNMHSSQATTRENNWNGANISRYMNPEFDALLDRYYVTVARSDRTRIVGQVMNQLTSEVLILGFFYTIEPVLVNNRIINVAGRYPRSSHAWNAYAWDVK
jgi:peptide/nickel transport system substrate-binding protein